LKELRREGIYTDQKWDQNCGGISRVKKYILNVLNLCDGEKMHLKLLCTQFEFEIFEEHF